MIDHVMARDNTYNAAVDLIERNLAAGRGNKAAFIDDSGSLTYAQLAERVDRFAHVLLALNIRREERIAVAMLDTCDWPVVFLGAIGYYLSSLLDFEGLRFITAGLERLILFLYPTIVAIISVAASRP